MPSSDPFPALELKQPEAMATEMLTGPTAPAGTTGPSAPLGAFHHEFTDMDAALAATYAHLDLGAVRVDDPTYPTTNEHHQQYVERLSLAIADVSNTRDLPPGSPPPNGKVPQAYGKFADGKYSARQIQGLAWEILVSRSPCCPTAEVGTEWVRTAEQGEDEALVGLDRAVVAAEPQGGHVWQF